MHEPRVSKKSYPELQALQKNADKSHEDFIAETKRLLEKSRIKKENELKREKEMKRQRKKSASQSGSSPNKSGLGGKTAAEKISDSNSADSADDIKRYDNPDSPKLSHQKTPKNATPPTVKSPLVQRKSAKESNIDSDSDSDVEWKSNSAKKSPRKNKTKRQAGSSSSEDEELGIRDRPRFFDQVGHQTTNASIEKKHFFTK